MTSDRPDRFALGHDTTAAAMSFTVQMLATNPVVMKKLQDEVDANFSNVPLDADSAQSVKVTAFISKFVKLK